MFSILKTLREFLLELDLEELEQQEIDALLRAIQDLKHHLTNRRETPTWGEKEPRKLMASNQATDNQEFTQVFSLADDDNVALEAGAVPVTVAVQDAAGGDLSKWIDVVQDAANPLQFVYRRKENDGTQPQELAFSAVATAQVAGKPVSYTTDFNFSPGAAATLTAVTSVSAIAGPAAEEPVQEAPGENTSASDGTALAGDGTAGDGVVAGSSTAS